MCNLTNYLIREGIPNLLLRNFNRTTLSQDVVLNVCPRTLPLLPSFHGIEHYFTVINTLRLITNGVLLKGFASSTRANTSKHLLSKYNDVTTSNSDRLIRIDKSSVIDERLWVYWTVDRDITVINGYFIFEFNAAKDKIVRHTIDNIEYTHYGKSQRQLFNKTNFI